MSAIGQSSAVHRVAYHHVERIHGLEAGDHGRNEGVSGHFGEDVALVPDVFDLFEADN